MVIVIDQLTIPVEFVIYEGVPVEFSTNNVGYMVNGMFSKINVTDSVI